MAQLTWRNIDAPNISIRDSVLAGQQVSGAFDRLGQILSDRETRLRTEATDAAIAQRLTMQDPNAVGNLDLSGLDKRVNLRALAEANNLHLAQLTERLRANEELLNSQAWAKYGTTIEALGTATLNGDTEAEATLRAGVSEDPMFARAIGQNEAWSKIVGFRDDRIDNLLQRDEFGEIVRKNRASEATANYNARTSRMQVSAAIARANREEARTAKKEADDAFGYGIARQYVRDIRPGQYADAEEAKTALARALQSRNVPKDRVSAILNNVTDQFNARFNPLQSEQDQVATLAGRGAKDVDIATAAIRDRAYRANLGLAIQDRVDKMDPEYINKLTTPEVTAKLSKAGLGDQATDIVRQALGTGTSLAELDAMAEVAPLQGPGFWMSVGKGALQRGSAGVAVGTVAGTAGTGGVGAPAGGPLGALIGGGVAGLYGAGEGVYDWYTRGPRLADHALNSLRNQPVIDAKRDEVTADIEKFGPDLRKQQRTLLKAQQEKVALGEVTSETQAELARLDTRLRQLARDARGSK